MSRLKINDYFDKMMDSHQMNRTFIDIDLKKELTDKLYKYQILHLLNIITSLIDNNISFDGSGTGTGKTYISIAASKHLKLKPIIICPKSVISMWKGVCELFDVEYEMITNYENIKTGNSHLFKIDKKTDKMSWYLNDNKHIIIFDEAHKCKDEKSINGKMLMSLLLNKCKILLLSATIADSPNNFYVYGYLLKLFKTKKQCKTYLDELLKTSKNTMANTSPLNEFLFPKYGSIMYMSDTNEQMPKNIISVNCYDIDDTDTKILDKAIKNIKSDLEITKINLARQEIEKIKIPIIIELTNKYIESGKSVVIFVNFIETLDQLANQIKTTCTINGRQELAERDANIELFQKNKSKIIICTIQTGGQSISLHDKTGHHPRVSIIIPSFSSIDLIQSLGRIYRSGVKSYCLQNIIYCANTYEENIASKIKSKLTFISNLTDNDLF